MVKRMLKLNLFILFLCVFVLAFSVSLFAGGGKEQESGETAEEKKPAEKTVEKPVTITWWTWWSPLSDEWDADYMEAIERETGVKVERTIYPFPDYLTALKAASMSGEGPDVFSTAGGGSPFGDFVPIFEPLEPWFEKTWGAGWKDRWGVFDIKDVLGVDPYGKTMYELPMTHQVGGIIWYNTAIFDEYGLEVPETYQELKEIADVLNANDIIPIAWGAKDQWPNKDWFITVAAQIAGDKYWQANQGNVKFTDPDSAIPGDDFFTVQFEPAACYFYCLLTRGSAIFA